METTKRTTITATDPAFPDGIELPWEPCEWIDPVVEGNILRYAVTDDTGGIEWEWPEGVEFVQGNRNYIHYCDNVDEWLERVNEDDSLTVFPVGVYEHSAIRYSLAGESIHSSDPWDYCVGACIAIPDDYTDPEHAARSLLETYTSWCNGDVYMIVEVDIDDPDNYATVGGVIGMTAAEEDVKSGIF